MDEAKASALREKRKQRLAATDNTVAPSRSIRAEEKPVGTPKQAATQTVLTASVAKVSKASPQSLVELVPFNEKSENPHWVVFTNGEPVAKIALADQSGSEEVRKMFMTKDYAIGVKQAVAKLGLEKVLSEVNGRIYEASISETDAYKSIQSKVADAEQTKFVKARATILDDFRNMFNMVVVAQNKNFINENPLKDALYKQMKQSGIADPNAAIENAFIEAGEAHFDFMFKQAETWASYSPETLSEIKNELTKRGHVMPVKPRGNNNDNDVPSSKNNVPFAPTTGFGGETRTAATEDQEKDQLRETFDFGKRNKNRTIRG